MNHIKENYYALRKEHESLLVKYENLIETRTVDEYDEIVGIVKQIPSQHLETARVRVKAMVDIIKNYA